MLSVPSYYFYKLEALNANTLGRTGFFVGYSSKSFWSTFGRVHEGIFCVMIQQKCLASFPKSNYLNICLKTWHWNLKIFLWSSKRRKGKEIFKWIHKGADKVHLSVYQSRKRILKFVELHSVFKKIFFNSITASPSMAACN